MAKKKVSKRTTYEIKAEARKLDWTIDQVTMHLKTLTVMLENLQHNVTVIHAHIGELLEDTDEN